MGKKEKERWNQFVYDVLPELKSKYEVKVFLHNIRVVGKYWDLDYYPKGQIYRILISKKTPNYLILRYPNGTPFAKMPISVFKQKFKLCEYGDPYNIIVSF
jgi:hypothetical protein